MKDEAVSLQADDFTQDEAVRLTTSSYDLLSSTPERNEKLTGRKLKAGKDPTRYVY